MEISRRDLIRTGAVLGGAGALASAVPGALSPAYAASAADLSTVGATLRRGTAGRGGYAPVVTAAGEPHQVRTDLGIAARSGRARRRKALLAFAQITDVHVIDAQSPARVEWFDRYDDQYSPDDPTTGIASSAYRPQEMLTAHVAEAMVRAINRIGAGPVSGRPLAFALQTGDNSDNSQHNEVRWNIDVLDGHRTVRPDSGSLTRFEGVCDDDPTYYDTHYWHPHRTPAGEQDDLAKSEFGFPTVPGLLDDVRRPFGAQGLAMPWYSAFGNHDELVQGNFPARTLQLELLSTGGLKVMSPPAGMTPNDLKKALGDPSFLVKALTLSPSVRPVTPDAGRRLLSRAEVVAEHFKTTGTPVGHGFTERNKREGTAHYTFVKGGIRFVVLDTVNPNGYAEGSLDDTQFAWLKTTLAASRDQLTIVSSHHNSATLTNPLLATGGDPGSDSGPRVLGDEVVALLLASPQVIAWVNGHSHVNQIWAHKRSDGSGGFWEVNTASHVDWPQQSRLVEVLDNADGTLSIFTTMVDHAGPASYAGRTDSPVRLAGLARELAANDPQERTTHREGERGDRNVELVLENPL